MHRDNAPIHVVLACLKVCEVADKAVHDVADNVEPWRADVEASMVVLSFIFLYSPLKSVYYLVIFTFAFQFTEILVF